MTTRGYVRAWHEDEGWGVIDSEDTPGGCWAHFSMVSMPGYRSLAPGEGVHFNFEAAEQDDYDFRAVQVWPDSQPAVGDESPTLGPSDGYQSVLILDFDPPDA